MNHERKTNKLNTEVKPLYLYIATAVCIVAAVGLAYLVAPRLLKPEVVEDTINLGTTRRNPAQESTDVNVPPQSTKKPTLSAPTPNQEKLCIQVITPAKNPETQEIRDFPTPCDVPEGWIILNQSTPPSSPL